MPTAALGELSTDQRDAIRILVDWGDTRADAERWIGRAAQLHDDLATVEDWIQAAFRIRSGAEV